jgi:hypothetical protein
MVTRRLCAFRFSNGEPCHSPPLHDSDFCRMHSPEHAKEVQESRRLGGLRRKKEVTLSGAYDLEPLSTVAGILRLIEIATLDTLSLENGVNRNRLLAYLALVALRTLEVGDQEQRMRALEQSVSPKNIQLALPVFDIETELLKTNDKEAS